MANIFDLLKKISQEREDKRIAGAPTHIICGLGNPGKKYAETSHNAGFMALSYLSQKEGFSINKLRFKSLVCDREFCGKRVLFMLPQTMMNLSGDAVREACDFYKIPIENVVVIQDDCALPVGKMRIRTKGSDGGQKGVRDIIVKMNSDEFTRIKLGVGSPPDPGQMINWVLGTVPKEDRAVFYSRIEDSYEALKLIMSGETQKAMNLYN
ncbi:MAG: aminoacyl-tRNA hydrolase [Clostridia bacterium]|nr:aminoacyl-tRNA hydrolase [Clostridia bacterium]